jgi:hypothetical protein
MRLGSVRTTWRIAVVVGATALVGAFAGTGATFANVSLQKVSTDPFTNTSSYHKTQVEPDTYAFGTTIVSAFQSGRFTDGGSSDVGWATSTDSGATPRWHSTPSTACGWCRPSG